MKEKRYKNNLYVTATNLYGLRRGPLWGLAAERKFRERFGAEEKICMIVAERAMRRKSHRKRHNTCIGQDA